MFRGQTGVGRSGVPIGVVGAAVGAAVGAGLAFWRRFAGRVEVTGTSMLPTLWPGDRLLVRRAPVAVRPGDLLVVPDPTARGRPLVKRAAELHGDTVVLHGDNPEASTDSRTWGRVPVEWVAGRAWYRYHPAERAGLLQR